MMIEGFFFLRNKTIILHIIAAFLFKLDLFPPRALSICKKVMNEMTVHPQTR